jgi:hypothetical protein
MAPLIPRFHSGENEAVGRQIRGESTVVQKSLSGPTRRLNCESSGLGAMSQDRKAGGKENGRWLGKLERGNRVCANPVWGG